MTKKKLKVLYVSSEVEPFSKTGGLADVAGSLPKALLKEGVDVRIVTPRYKDINAEMQYVADFPLEMRGHTETCIIREGSINADKRKKVPVYFVDNYYYYGRPGLYCHFDDGDRFAFFDKAVLEMLPHINFKPDIIHCNDWQAGPIPLLLKEKYKANKFYSKIATIITVHNLMYQGNFGMDILEALGLSNDYFNVDYTEFYGAVGFMKIGLKFADIINAVSPTYAKEIQTEQYGERLNGLIEERADRVFGILNGLDTDTWNPEKDSDIYKNFNIDTFEEGKAENKTKLQKRLKLPVKKDVPVISLVSRLVDQKGLDLIAGILVQLLRKDVQVIFLGVGDPYYEKLFKNLERSYPKKMRACIEFNSELAKKIYAGSDMFLMPSAFEPCGLGQMMSLRYGTIPIARKTGGLADTVIDYSNKNGNGFVFSEYTQTELFNSVKTALKVYDDKAKWNELVERAMKCDFSWDKSALEYIKLYNKAMEVIK